MRHTSSRGMGRHAQRGLSFWGLLFVVMVVGGAVMLGIRISPSAIEYQSVLKAVKKSATEGSPQAIRAAFDRSASVDYISSIDGKDLEITKITDARSGGDQGYRVSFAYQKEISLFGPASLLLRYTGSSK